MANGYLRIKKTDIYENNGVIYWKNGANIIGNVVKCVDSEETEHYYIESLKTKKAILLDDNVKIGGGDFGFESTNGNFILVTTGEVDFSDIGGGNGVSITFTFGNRYYTVTLPEDNGDLKIYAPDGEGGEIGGNDVKYSHRILLKGGSASPYLYARAIIINNDSTPFTQDTLSTFVKNYCTVNSVDHYSITQDNIQVYSNKLNYIFGLHVYGSGNELRYDRIIFTVAADTGNVSQSGEYNTAATLQTDLVTEI